MLLTTEKINRLEFLITEIKLVQYLLLEKNTYVFVNSQDSKKGLRVTKDLPVEGFMFNKISESLEEYLTHLKSLLLAELPAHDWIEATLTNLKAHGLYTRGDYDDCASDVFSGYLFLINNRSVISPEDFYVSYEHYHDEADRPETGSLTATDCSKLVVTHFAKVVNNV